jgi:hypothetical protein
MQEIKEKLLESINNYVTSENASSYLKSKLVEVKSKLSESASIVDDSTVSEYMLYAKLVDELTTGGSDV